MGLLGVGGSEVMLFQQQNVHLLRGQIGVVGLAAVHWHPAFHHPAVPAAHISTVLPGVHSGESTRGCSEQLGSQVT